MSATVRDILAVINNGAGILALIVTVFAMWVVNQIRIAVGELKIELATRDRAIIQEIAQAFIRKPELVDDYPIGRREFSGHKEEDREQHKAIDMVVERHHIRIRSLEEAVSKNEQNIFQLGIKLNRGMRIAPHATGTDDE